MTPGTIGRNLSVTARLPRRASSLRTAPAIVAVTITAVLVAAGFVLTLVGTQPV